MSFPFRLRWSCESTVLERYVAHSFELHRSFEIIALEAQYTEAVYEVDLFPLNPYPFEPEKVQVLVGHPSAARITVHQDGRAYVVRVRDFAGVPEKSLTVRRSGAAPENPGMLMVPAESVFGLVRSICVHNVLPGWADLIERAGG
ncbi:hypothetical protein [Paractinoplanes brasiliensis]|uniref:Uncharacterized protein n=1 Tax=Paractinoplanes brasiliensis TaxID=52695 RepID=A0A4V3C7C4_9ACTN|nr:hypothetical protein [Actinoplanes brasiliensis]TDO37098.1 hypothetical protein C8E87_0693 [Actinoplanes brasiliensis]GID32208.1 hypothetical protein Abr02nite_71910 [Actinoplanes brasiliensis]